MTNDRPLRIPHDTVAAQQRAADPLTSVWVEANAGSGKTFVLTRRVLRLLLAGVRPEAILCLTYTKAAAAEMRKRVTEQLAAWAVRPEPEVRRLLAELTGAEPATAELRRARTLFAHALETPGGLKIVTIHAFCESVLHRFPVEARVPFDFSVIEDHDREQLILQARESVLAGGLNGGSEAVETLFELLSDGQIADAIDAALTDARKLRAVLAKPGAAKRELRRLVGTPPGETRRSVLAAAVGGSLFPPERWDALFAQVPPDVEKSSRLNFSERLYRLRGREPDGLELFGAYLRDGREPYKDRCIAKVADPALAAAIGAEHDRLAALHLCYRRAALVERSEALLDVLAAISAHYQAAKRARSLLDFDDLVERFVDLVRDEAQGPWVRYKLDAALTHILVDESQDTNAEQWEAVRLLAQEFFDGASAVTVPRTLFAVGDGKQSIYSFQGADPRLFGDSGRDFQVRAEAVAMRFSREPLHTSFRTLPGVLAAVDAVFAEDELRRAVLAEDPVGHNTARADPGGVVTLWPPVQSPADPLDDEQWPLRVPEEVKSAPRLVAERIAGEIKIWLAQRRPLGPRGRAVRADDVLILVQSRSALFHEIIRALIREGLPTPGADRLAVTGHIAVLDLLALGDVLLNPADNLQLAALLRSPLFDVSEDELLALAQPRPSRARLWDALATCAIPSGREAFARLRTWRARLDFDRPFEFFAQVLYAEGGLRRFHARLGLEVDDVFAEFLELALAHEQSSQPSLQGFLAAMRAREVTITRELGESVAGVRVMTVHGAKGLEAPVVILADAASRPSETQTAAPVVLRTHPPLLVHAPGGKDHLPATRRLRDEDQQVQEQEYWRKLYVGMTRAEDELYVTGALTPGRDAASQLKGSWYEAVETALRPDCEVVTTTGAECLIYPRQRPSPAPVHAGEPAPAAAPFPLVLEALPPAPRRAVLTPSSAPVPGAQLRRLERLDEDAPDPELSRQRGIAVHVLLEHLAPVPADERQLVARQALEQRFPDLAPQHQAITARALAILGQPRLSHLFGPDSRAEVPFLVEIHRDGVPTLLRGRIDRLVVGSEHVLIVDYKSDEIRVREPADTPPAYVNQLALYALAATQLFPGRRVHAAILWTALESLLELPGEMLERTAGAFTKR